MTGGIGGSLATPERSVGQDSRAVRMIDRIRQDPAGVRKMLELRHFEAPLERIVELDKKVKDLTQETEALRAERNKASKGGPPSDEVKVRMRQIGDRIKTIEGELGPLEAERDELVLHVPNVVHPDAPVGDGE